MEFQKQLLNFLNDEGQPLENRLRIVIHKFTGIDKHIVKSRETILNSLKQKLLDPDYQRATERKLILRTLKHCITALTDIALNPQLADHVFELLHLTDFYEPELTECFVEVLKNPHFLKYFVNRVQKFSEVITVCLRQGKVPNGFSNSDRHNMYNVILESILFVKNHSFQYDELKLVFVQSLIEPLSEMSLETRNGRLVDVFYQVLFSDKNFQKAFAINIFSANGDDLASNVIATIRNYPTYLKSKILTCAYSLIFEGFLCSNANSNAKFRVFLALNSFIYMRPVSLNDENPKCVMFKENVETSNTLLELLLSGDIALDSVAQTISLNDWLKALIDIVLSEIKNNLTCPVIQMLKTALSFSPILLENCLRKFTKNVMLVKKIDPTVLQKYSELCLYVLSVHIKLNRMHKFISALLITIKDNLSEFQSADLPNKFDILPEHVFDEIQSAVTNLPSTVQNVALLNVLLYHLENDCVAALEDSKEVDAPNVLLFGIVSYLISRFVSGTRIMDYSVPEVVKEKFILLMENLGNLLGRCGKAIISKKHDSDLVECFLHLCTVWGDMQLVFMTYESTPRRVTKQVGATGISATNLVYLHPYLSDYHWNLIAQRVANFGHENCVRQLNTLVLQKIHALRYIEDEIEGPFLEKNGPANACALYLKNQTDVRWVFDHISEYVHLLEPTDILEISKNLVKYCEACDEEIQRVLPSDFQETRPLVLGMISYAFHNLGRNLKKRNLKELSRALRRLNYVEMIEVEMGADISLESVLDEIGQMVSCDFRLVENAEDDVNTDSMKKFADLLLHLPAQYLHKENKSIVCLLTLCLMKSLIQLRTFDNVKALLEDLAKFLQSILTNVWLPDTLDCGNILIWFYCGLKNMSCCEWTMRKLCEAQRNYQSEVDKVVEIVKAAVGGQSPTDVFIQSCNEGIDFVTSYLINFQKTRKRKNDSSGDEVVKKLRKLCYENFEEIFDSRPIERKQLSLYTILLNEALQSEKMKRVKQLSARLPTFLNFMEENLDFTSEETSQFLLTILRYVKHLRPYLPNNFIVNTWESQWYKSDYEMIKGFLRVASLEEYEEMIDLLITCTDCSLDHCEESELPILSHIWKLVLNTSVKMKKARVKRDAVSKFCVLAQKYAIADENAAHNSTHRLIIQILTAVLQNAEIPLHYQTVDLCFDLISLAVSSNPSDEFLIECVEMLFVFCLVWRSMLLDRIPTFYLCYKSLFALIVRRAEDKKIGNIEELSCVVHKFEKLTDNLVKCRKDFTKTAISAVSDLLNVFIEVKVDNRLETPFKNIIYCWIGMCDSHGLQYLSTAMSPVAQNMFKEYQSEYHKYYKFSGKV